MLEKQIEKMDAEYDKCNEVMAKGEVSGFDKAFLGNNFNFMNVKLNFMECASANSIPGLLRTLLRK